MAGQKGQFRYGFERAEGVPDLTSTFTPFESETFSMDLPYEPDPNLDPSGNETEGDNLKAEGTGTLVVAPNTEDLLQMRIHHHGFYEHTTPEAGVELWELRDFNELTDVALDHYVDSLWFGAWRDQRVNPTEYNGIGLKVSEFTLSVDANKHVHYEHQGLFLRDRFMRNPVEVAVNAAWLGGWVTRGHRQGGDENGDYYKFKIVTPGALGVATLVWGKGAAAYGATEYVITDDWIDVRNADDTLAGTRRQPFQIRPLFAGAFTADDEWRIHPTSPKPVSVTSPRPKLNGTALELRFSLNGGATWITKVIDQYSLKMGQPREAKFSLGSMYAQEIGFPDNSKRWWELSFNRTYVDRDFEQARVSGTVISAYAKFWGAPIGATGEEDYAEFTLERMKLSQAGATVTNAGDLPENPVLRAFSQNGSPLCVEKYQNTIADVHPT